MKTKLLETIALTHAYYNPGQTLQNAVLAMYADDLRDLDPEECIRAYGAYRRNPKNTKFPLPSVIREIVAPEESISTEAKASEIAARICGAVPKFGWCNGSEAREYIGPIGWDIVQRQGGWPYICENLGTKINPSSFQAQLRNQLDSNIRYGVKALESTVLSMPESISNILKLRGTDDGGDVA